MAAEAALRLARLNLAYTAVRAPIAGRLSRANVTAGNLVNEQVVLTTIAATNRVHAYFDGSEQTFLRVKAAGNAKPVVREAADTAVNVPYLDTIAYLLGISREDIEAVDAASGLVTPAPPLG